MNERPVDAPPAPARRDDLAAFLAVARNQGLSAAARDIGSCAPTLGRRMLALERALGRDLFIRHTRGHELTEAGKQRQRRQPHDWHWVWR